MSSRTIVTPDAVAEQLQDMDALLAPSSCKVGRRGFLSGVLAGGFALAVQPVCAETLIKTSSKGLKTGMTKIETVELQFPAYFAMPSGKGPFPTVLVVQEIFGLHEWVRDICRRLAKEGYLAVAPALYARYGDPAKEPSVADIQQKIVAKVADAQVIEDLDATVRWAQAHGANMDRLAITGFCWGGRIAWLYAAYNTDLKAAAAWYGRLVNQSTMLTPNQPLQLVNELKTPVLGLYGGQDKSITADHIAQMRSALATAHSKSEIVVYPEAQHGFLADYRPSYNAEAAKDGWKRMLDWFKAHGV